MSPPELTATAGGTEIPTYTPYPTYSPYPTYTPQPTDQTPTPQPWPTSIWPTNQPPDQPVTACDSPCYRPGSVLELAGWIEYAKCDAFKYVAWCPEHSATMEAVPTMFAGQEPFGTIGEISESVHGVETLVAQYDWSAGGLPGQELPPDPATFFDPLAPENPWNAGEIQIYQDSTPYSVLCDYQLADVLGARLAAPMCFIFNILHELALMPWLQLFVDVFTLIAFGIYIHRRWMNPAME
jgi:hypothetical protein